MSESVESGPRAPSLVWPLSRRTKWIIKSLAAGRWDVQRIAQRAGVTAGSVRRHRAKYAALVKAHREAIEAKRMERAQKRKNKMPIGNPASGDNGQ